jgi:lipopolysaccharide export LptBFGC system permease protein LptF
VRYALSCAPFVLVLLPLSIVFRNPGGRMNRAVAACAAVGFYYLCLWGGRPLVLDGSMPAFAAVWLPNVLIGLSSIAVMATGRQRPGESDSQILSS